MRKACLLMIFLGACDAPTSDDAADVPVAAGDGKADRVVASPFDAGSCRGKPSDLSKLAAGTVLGHYTMTTRTRLCVWKGDSCGNWDGTLDDSAWDGLSGQLVVDGNGLTLVPDPAHYAHHPCSYPRNSDHQSELGMKCPLGGGDCGEYYGSGPVQAIYDNGWFTGTYECLAWPLEAERDQGRPGQAALRFTATVGKRCVRIVGDGALDQSSPTTEGQAALLVRF